MNRPDAAIFPPRDACMLTFPGSKIDPIRGIANAGANPIDFGSEKMIGLP